MLTFNRELNFDRITLRRNAKYLFFNCILKCIMRYHICLNYKLVLSLSLDFAVLLSRKTSNIKV